MLSVRLFVRLARTNSLPSAEGSIEFCEEQGWRERERERERVGSDIHTRRWCSVAASRRLFVEVVRNGGADGDRDEDEQPRDPDHRPARCHSPTAVAPSSFFLPPFIGPNRAVLIPDDLENDLCSVPPALPARLSQPVFFSSRSLAPATRYATRLDRALALDSTEDHHHHGILSVAVPPSAPFIYRDYRQTPTNRRRILLRSSEQSKPLSSDFQPLLFQKAVLAKPANDRYRSIPENDPLPLLRKLSGPLNTN